MHVAWKRLGSLREYTAEVAALAAFGDAPHAVRPVCALHGDVPVARLDAAHCPSSSSPQPVSLVVSVHYGN